MRLVVFGMIFLFCLLFFLFGLRIFRNREYKANFGSVTGRRALVIGFFVMLGASICGVITLVMYFKNG